MTVTLAYLDDQLVVEHWSTRLITPLSPDMDPDAIRTALVTPLRATVTRAPQRLVELCTPEKYKPGASSLMPVSPWDAETVFNRPVPGRPDPDETVLVDLPPVSREVQQRQGRRPTLAAPRPQQVVRSNHVAHVVLDDIERAVVMAVVHFRLAEAGLPSLTIKAASADYRESIVVTSGGTNGTVTWWLDQAQRAGVTMPRARKLDARFTRKGELVFAPRQKQVS